MDSDHEVVVPVPPENEGGGPWLPALTAGRREKKRRDAVPEVTNLPARLSIRPDVVLSEQGDIRLGVVRFSHASNTTGISMTPLFVQADRARRGGLGIQPQIREPVEEGADPDRHFGSRHVHAEADVWTAAEAESGLQRPERVVLVRTFPSFGITVGGADAQVQHGPLGQMDAVEIDVLGDPTREHRIGRHPAQGLLDRSLEQGAVRSDGAEECRAVQ